MNHDLCRHHDAAWGLTPCDTCTQPCKNGQPDFQAEIEALRVEAVKLKPVISALVDLHSNPYEDTSAVC